MVAVRLPEPGFITLGELKPFNLLRGLPEIKVWDEKPRGSSVVALERTAFIAQRNHCLTTREIRDRNIGGVSIV
jgi:hypothetical protein